MFILNIQKSKLIQMMIFFFRIIKMVSKNVFYTHTHTQKRKIKIKRICTKLLLFKNVQVKLREYYKNNKARLQEQAQNS